MLRLAFVDADRAFGARGDRLADQIVQLGRDVWRLDVGVSVLVAQKDEAAGKMKLMDVVERKPVPSSGSYDASKAEVSTYKLVGPEYFNFFAMLMAIVGLLFIVVAFFYKEKTHLRDEAEPLKA